MQERQLGGHGDHAQTLASSDLYGSKSVAERDRSGDHGKVGSVQIPAAAAAAVVPLIPIIAVPTFQAFGRSWAIQPYREIRLIIGILMATTIRGCRPSVEVVRAALITGAVSIFSRPLITHAT